MKTNANPLRAILSCAFLFCTLAGRLAFAVDGISQTPAPTGPYRVGTRTLHLFDATRRDPFLAGEAARELALRFWYPASAGPNCWPAPYTAPRVWSSLAQLTGISLPPVSTNSCQDAAIAHGPHPVILFSHGYTGMFTDATFLFEDLASRGYVIASVAHTYESTAVELQDGRIAKSAFGSYLAPGAMRSDLESLTRAFTVRLADLNFVLGELLRLNADNGPFAGNLDLAHIAVMGHSLGGVAALASLEHESSISAVVAIDPVLLNVPVRATTRPVLILTAGRERWSQSECALWSHLHGPRLAVNLRGADHFTPSDASWLFGQMPESAEPAETMESPKTVAEIREYIAAFLETNLMGRPPRVLLKHPSPDFTNIAITTTTQQLCSGSRAD